MSASALRLRNVTVSQPRYADFITIKATWRIDIPLTPNELAALSRSVAKPHSTRKGMGLDRLIEPLWALKKRFQETKSSDSAWYSDIRKVLRIVESTGKTYWQWTDEEWATYLRSIPMRNCRLPMLLVVLLAPSGLNAIPMTELVRARLNPVAHSVFGEKYAQLEQRLVDEALRLGFHPVWQQKRQSQWRHVLATFVLTVGTCSLPADDTNAIKRLDEGTSKNYRYLTTAMLAAMHSLNMCSVNGLPTRQRWITPSPTNAWDIAVDEWSKNQTRHEPAAAKRCSVMLRTIGRWFAANGRRTGGLITEPSALTKKSVQGYSRAVHSANVGDFNLRSGRRHRNHGEAMKSSSKLSLLKSLRRFIEDLVDMEYIPAEMVELTSHLTPSFGLKAQIRQDPRFVPRTVFEKILSSVIALKPEDVSEKYYPFTLFRAVAMVWLFGGLRADEIRRLSADCIGEIRIVEGVEIALIVVPANKWRGAFTKPVPREIADAINAWKSVRPVGTFRRDRKTGRNEEHLFTYRGRLIGEQYLSMRVVPRLLKLAGLSEYRDRHGKINPHRMRSTLATLLMDGADGMSLLAMKDWLGHIDDGTVTAYAASISLPKAFARAQGNVVRQTVYLDEEAVRDGIGTSTRPYLVVDVDDARGGCRTATFDACKNNMDCLGSLCKDNLATDGPLMQRLRLGENAQRLQRELLLQPSAIVLRNRKAKATRTG